MSNSQFVSIQRSELSDVIGGVNRMASGGGSNNNDTALLQTVTQLQSSLADLGKNQQQDPMSQMMPMMMMMGMKH
jgi:hypothetical protein